MSQEQFRQFSVCRSHQHFTVDFENGNQMLSRQLIHGAQGAEVLGNVTFDVNNSVLGQPTPRMFAQRTSGNHIKRYQVWLSLAQVTVVSLNLFVCLQFIELTHKSLVFQF